MRISMNKKTLAFFQAIVNEPSPSGFEEGVAELYRQHTGSFADEVTTDSHGNVTAVLNPKAKMKIMLAGHMDEIGFVVHYISPEGLLYISQVGGHDSAIIVGQRVWVHGMKGRIPGVIGRKAIHLLDAKERELKPKLEDMWVDIGASSKDSVARLVQLGDPVTYQAEFQLLQEGRATARGFDNKMGAFIVAEALRHLKEQGGLHPEVGVYAVGTVQEEIGLRGAKTSAFAIDAQSGIAVDVNHATDYPTISKTKHGEIVVGKGPTVTRSANVNPIVHSMLEKAAVKAKIPYQTHVYAGITPTDANPMQVNRTGMATGLIGVPLRYMHTPCEVLALEDVKSCILLMAEYCRLVTPKSDFTPRKR